MAQFFVSSTWLGHLFCINFFLLKKNGLFITSCDICECSINVQLILKYNKQEKIFSLVEESKGVKKSEIKHKKIFQEDQVSGEDKKEEKEEKEKNN